MGRFFRRAKWWVKATAKVLALSVPLTVEIRDQLSRRTWAPEPLAPTDIDTGDIVMVSHRWFTRPFPTAMQYSLWCKVAQKTSWDTCGVIVKDNGVPHILMQDYNKVVYEPLDDYIQRVVPRGVAVRRFGRTKPPVDPEAVTKFVKEATSEDVVLNPWFLIRAAKNRPRNQQRHFAMQCRASEAEWIYLTKKRKQYSDSAVEDAKYGYDSVQHAADELKKVIPPPLSPKKNTCGSLTASFLALCGYIPDDAPDLSFYIPADFVNPLPLQGVEIAENRVIFVD